jgi:hypothetical protein
LAPVRQFAQHGISILAELDPEKKTINIQQEIIFRNTTADTLKSIVLNDWNNAYSSKSTPLAQRFSDEFVRSFHLAREEERGNTSNITVIDNQRLFLSFLRPAGKPDILEVFMREPLAPGQEISLSLTYTVKLPSDRFTRYGYGKDGTFSLKYWYLAPARYENHDFVRYSNSNIDDIANSTADYKISFNIPKNLEITSDLNIDSDTGNSKFRNVKLSGSNRTDFTFFIEPKSTFYSFRNDLVDVQNGLKDSRVGDIRKAVIVDRIVNYVNENIGKYPHQKIVVSQTDYERNPFYGLNQLPSFISPFPDEFIYEIKFLKTYINNYLKYSLKLDPRKDNWIYDGIQIYIMMKYIDEHYPDSKMMGSLSSMKLLKGFNLTNLSFNGQYSYFYMLMARKNIDQPIGDPKDTFIKFNEQIAGKYRAGLSFRYLDDYLGNNIVQNSIGTFYSTNTQRQTSGEEFQNLLKANSPKKIDWFFTTVIHSRDIIDYKFDDVIRGKDSVTFTIKNRTGTTVPIPLYGVTRQGDVVFKEWLENISTDSTFTRSKQNADKLVLNYRNEVPEYNQRNNWSSLKDFVITNRPIKFNFMKDLEDPVYNQVLYVPTLTYNLYDGLSPGIRFHNKTILDKPFTIDANPAYSTNTKSLTGSMLLAFNQSNREGSLYNMRYSISGNYFHYAPDAAYFRLNPLVQFRFRPENFRSNQGQMISVREVIVHRDKSNFITDNNNQNYAVFDAKYVNSKSEATNHFNIMGDLQFAGKFGKAIAEFEYRKLFENNRQIDIRLYAGTFLYNRTNSDFFSFALDRPTDYLFDYNYYGRSEDEGLYSQQLVVAEGGFKSKLDTPYANQWITTLNTGVNVWNWIELYADAGLIKNRNADAKFLYDSGVRLNLVTDYFELYFPVYSSNGWEIGQKNYGEKIRFIVTLDPKILVKLFTRKWF